MNKNKSKDEIFRIVCDKINKVLEKDFVTFELGGEGSMTESYKYLSKLNTRKILEMCFEETYKEVNDANSN